MLAKNSDFARLAESAACRALARSRVRSSASAEARCPVDCRFTTNPASSRERSAVHPAAHADGVLLKYGNLGVRRQLRVHVFPAISSFVVRSNGRAADLAPSDAN